MRLTMEGLRRGAPWAGLVVALWLLQVWSIWDSPFSMEITMLQGVFVAVFVVVIFILAQARLDEA